MARFPLTIPPGVFRNGTEYQSKGRYFDANLVRWYGAALGPIGGWRARGSDKPTGMARAALAWKDNSQNTWLGIGTHSGLFVSDRTGTVTDITPIGFTAGRADAIAAGGYGTVLYGASTFGTPRPDSTLIQDATEWTLDTWGEYLVGVSPDDGKIYQWELDIGTPAEQVENSPDCSAVVVTPQRFMFALGTDDPRTISWCDQEDNTDWTTSETNQAGSFPLQTAGRLMCGKNVSGGTLLLTDIDAWLATYVGGVFVYSFDRKGSGCGAISRQAAIDINGQCVWMSQSGFWLYNGYVQPIECDLLDYIRRDINLSQISKIVAVHNSAYAEVEWRYCSANSTTIDRCVVWNYGQNTWVLGRPRRTCGVDRGVFQYPILIGGDGTIYDHEIGNDYGGDTPWAKTGPIELGNGDQIMHVMGLYPDDATEGDVTAAFTVRRNPDDPGADYGPFSLTARTDLRFSGGIVEVLFEGAATAPWRVGTPKLELLTGEGR